MILTHTLANTHIHTYIFAHEQLELHKYTCMHAFTPTYRSAHTLIHVSHDCEPSCEWEHPQLIFDMRSVTCLFCVSVSSSVKIKIIVFHLIRLTSGLNELTFAMSGTEPGTQ